MRNYINRLCCINGGGTCLMAMLMLLPGVLLAQSPTAYGISSGDSRLLIHDLGTGLYGVRIELDGLDTYYMQDEPIAVEVVDSNGNNQFYTGSYSAVEDLGDNTFKGTGTISSPNGSTFLFTDIFKPYDDKGAFEIIRSVTVTAVDENDKGFSTRMAFHRPVDSGMDDYDFFAPATWYKDNANVSDNALASSYSDYYYWFREDRLPLPLFMLWQKDNGATFSVAHKDADGTTFTGEDGLNRIIDERMKFAALGMQNNVRPLVGLVYPGTEGERTGIWGMSAERRWAPRNHPVTEDFTQHYKMIVSLTAEPDYRTALKNTWQKYYMMYAPQLYDVELNKVYDGQIDILSRYWKDINGAPGVPFRIKLDGSLASELDYNFNMGFVGHQIGNASLMIREGFRSENSALLSKGEKMVDFWAENAIMPSGIPRTWYDPYPETWRNEPVHLRVVGDGMSGMLWAWNFEQRNGIDKRSWLNACVKVADWLRRVQNNDGSFYQQYDYHNGNVISYTKNSTSNVIPFLVDLYKVTGEEAYKQMAISAGDYIYAATYEQFHYAGGAIDNPNVPDKEAVSMALRAFLALYDLNKDEKWLEAALQSGYYYQSWVFAWDVPIPQDDPNTTFPKDRSMTGLSQIATGNNAADSYAAIDAFNFYRLYLYAGDPQLLNFSQLLLRNTKQYMNWDSSDPIPGFAPGFLGEALTVFLPRGHGVDFFLPWQTFNMLEPMVLLYDIFDTGSYSITGVEQLPPADIQERHEAYSETRGYAEAGKVTGTTNKVHVPVPLIYPNPAGNAVKINGLPAGGQVIKITIENVKGQRVYEATISNKNNLLIRSDHLKNGIYTVSIISEEAIVRKKLVITK